MRDLSKNDWRVLAELLEMASESSIKHGVDEFKLDNTKENLELVVLNCGTAQMIHVQQISTRMITKFTLTIHSL